MSDWDACLFVGWFVVDFGLRYAQSIGCGGNGIRTMNALFIFYYKHVCCLSVSYFLGSASHAETYSVQDTTST